MRNRNIVTLYHTIIIITNTRTELALILHKSITMRLLGNLINPTRFLPTVKVIKVDWSSWRGAITFPLVETGSDRKETEERGKKGGCIERNVARKCLPRRRPSICPDKSWEIARPLPHVWHEVTLDEFVHKKISTTDLSFIVIRREIGVSVSSRTHARILTENKYYIMPS